MSLARASSRLKTSSRRRAARATAGSRRRGSRRLVASRPDAVVLDERPPAEVAPAAGCRSTASGRSTRRPGRDDRPDGAGNARPAGSSSVKRDARTRGPRRASATTAAWRSSSTRRRSGGSGRPASVVPASPTNSSSESRSSVQTATVDCTCGIATVRRPISAPLRAHQRRDAIGGQVGAGSTVIVAPRASLLWKPMPALT